MSLGEDRVRVKFNPSATGLVDQIKQKTAELIDLVETMRQPAGTISGEHPRLIDEAQTRFEDAAHWAVKAATAAAIKTPATIDELSQILNSENPRPVHINPDGSISEIAN